jgi:uncharacterized membrane protein YjgN (DUF898 family)
MKGVQGGAGALGADERLVQAEFTGTASEYFRVWIVNLFFTLVTLGIYSAWAKVRKRRYLYGCTRLDGDSFDYFASPKAVLRGRIVAVAIFVAYALAGEMYPASQFAFWGIGLLALPWLLVKAVSFNARNSAYRGLRFDFGATPRQAARVYLGMLLVVVLTAGLALPWFMARHKAFIASHHAFGTSGFRCELPARSFFGIYILAGLIALGFAVPAAALSGYLAYLQMNRTINLPESVAWLVWVLPLLPIYVGYAIAYAYAQARTANLFWSCVQGEGVRFASTLSAWGLTKLYFGNLFAVACTAGMLIPWAVVRTLRYRLANFSMIVAGAPVYACNANFAPVGAASQELGDFFNVDVGL